MEKRLKEVIRRVMSNTVNIDEINSATSLVEDLGFDSIELVELIVEIEQEFSIIFEDEDLDIENLILFSRLINMVEGKIG